MRLGELVAGVADLSVEVRGGGSDPEIHAVVRDTAEVAPGALFCCVRGAHVDGHELAGRAVAAGAVALAVDHPLDVAVPQVILSDVRAAMGPLAAAFWGHPSRTMTVVGVTGTSGKTTVTHLLRSIFEAAGQPCALIGTLSGVRTTPEATELQALLAAERDGGRRAVAMEVSSHGLELHRVDATRFAAAVFTNLSRDHLDFHGTIDDYFAAKARLFTPDFTDRAAVCGDDPWGRKLLGMLEGSRTGGGGAIDVRPYGVADAHDLRLDRRGSHFVWRGETIGLRLTGRFNVLNAVAAATAAEQVGLAPDVIARGLAATRPVAGRFEPIDAGQPFSVLVDYSHKPDALDQALAAARELTAGPGRVVVVFGCGGDRDATKRPVMGEVAARRADRIVLTSDNPRSEDPLAIIADVHSGIPAGAPLLTEVDRRRAISAALAEARPGDVVVIAGKGHEMTQVIGDRAEPFDDREVARAALADVGWGGGRPH